MILENLSNDELVEKYDELFTQIADQLGDSSLVSDFEEVVIELQLREEQRD